MGRLFWKIFFAFWLAQLAAGAGTGTLIWLHHKTLDQTGPQPPSGGPPLPGGFPADGTPGMIPPGKPPGPPPPMFLIATGLLASLLFSAWLAWYLSRPIHHLRRAFDALADGKLDTRIGPLMSKRRDELSDLGRNFDHMAGRIGALVEAQRRLLHDVSHELRSPLARMQAAIGLLRQQPDKVPATAERIERESVRLDHLVEELLTLSRLEAGVPGNREEDIPMAALLAEIVEDARFEAEAKAIRIVCDFTEEVLVRGQAELIHRAIENIIRNAIRHSPPEGLVVIRGSLDPARRRLHLGVCDEGRGVLETQLSDIFEPFFKGEDLPSKSGAGLGLAIARRAVEAHGGTIQASNKAEGGLCVEIQLPVPG